MSDNTPDIVVGRLPLYLRALTRLEQEGHQVTSSHELGKQLDISPAQIRKDLAHFGEFGKQGTGYEIPYLRQQIARILHINREWAIAVVGAGHLGHALANYRGFGPRGFHIQAIFDNDPARVGVRVGELVVQPMEHLEANLRKHRIKIAMIAVPVDVAQTVAERLIHSGVRAILNYAPIKLVVPSDVCVQDIDPVIHLQHMTYYLNA